MQKTELLNEAVMGRPLPGLRRGADTQTRFSRGGGWRGCADLCLRRSPIPHTRLEETGTSTPLGSAPAGMCVIPASRVSWAPVPGEEECQGRIPNPGATERKVIPGGLPLRPLPGRPPGRREHHIVNGTDQEGSSLQ